MLLQIWAPNRRILNNVYFKIVYLPSINKAVVPDVGSL